MPRTCLIGATAVFCSFGMTCLEVLAGPALVEPGGTDAGSTPDTALVASGSGSLRSIQGNLMAVEDGAADFEDMYAINITQPAMFCAKTVLVSQQLDCCGQPTEATQGTNFNTQLWLFRSTGHGLLANDDISGVSQLSQMGNTATDGSGAMVVLPGLYYIAISGGPNRDPVSTTGLIFNQATPIEVSGPDGPGGGNPIMNWIGPGATNVHYEIVLCGVEFLPSIPTVSEWGLLTMIVLMALGGAAMIARRRGATVTAVPVK